MGMCDLAAAAPTLLTSVTTANQLAGRGGGGQHPSCSQYPGSVQVVLCARVTLARNKDIICPQQQETARCQGFLFPPSPVQAPVATVGTNEARCENCCWLELAIQSCASPPCLRTGHRQLPAPAPAQRRTLSPRCSVPQSTPGTSSGLLSTWGQHSSSEVNIAAVMSTININSNQHFIERVM